MYFLLVSGVGYTLVASANGISSVTSNPFNVTSSIAAAESQDIKARKLKWL